MSLISKNKILKLTLPTCKIIIFIFLALYICICYLMSYEVGISDIEYMPLYLKSRNMCYIFIIKLFSRKTWANLIFLHDWPWKLVKYSLENSWMTLILKFKFCWPLWLWVSQNLALTLYSIPINEILVIEFITVKVPQNWNLM